MNLSSLILSCALLITSAFAFTTPDFEVKNLQTTSPSNGTTGNKNKNVTISFIVHDPDPLTNSSTSCAYEWAYNSSNYPTGGYAPCTDSDFSWNFADNSYENSHTFELQVEHTYEDPSVGAYPYNFVTNFARLSIVKANLTCWDERGNAGGEMVCKEPASRVWKAPVWATIAKKR